MTVLQYLPPRPRPRPGNVARSSSDLLAQARQPSAARARTQSQRKARTTGASSIPSRRSLRRDRAVSRELGVNSLEWRPEACFPLRCCYPGPTRHELEADAGKSGRLLPGASAQTPDHHTFRCAHRAGGPESGGLCVWRLGPPCNPDPPAADPGRFAGGEGCAVKLGI